MDIWRSHLALWISHVRHLEVTLGNEGVTLVHLEVTDPLEVTAGNAWGIWMPQLVIRKSHLNI